MDDGARISRYLFWLQTFWKMLVQGSLFYQPQQCTEKSPQKYICIVLSSQNWFFFVCILFWGERHCENSQNLLTSKTFERIALPDQSTLVQTKTLCWLLSMPFSTSAKTSNRNFTKFTVFAEQTTFSFEKKKGLSKLKIHRSQGESIGTLSVHEIGRTIEVTRKLSVFLFFFRGFFVTSSHCSRKISKIKFFGSNRCGPNCYTWMILYAIGRV